MYFCVKKDIWVGGALFVAALTVKQMALYYSIPFFAFILGKIYLMSGLNSPQVPGVKILVNYSLMTKLFFSQKRSSGFSFLLSSHKKE